jgi:hypothetical protein
VVSELSMLSACHPDLRHERISPPGARSLITFTGVSILPKRPSVTRRSWPTNTAYAVRTAVGGGSELSIFVVPRATDPVACRCHPSSAGRSSDISGDEITCGQAVKPAGAFAFSRSLAPSMKVERLPRMVCHASEANP